MLITSVGGTDEGAWPEACRLLGRALAEAALRAVESGALVIVDRKIVTPEEAEISNPELEIERREPHSSLIELVGAPGSGAAEKGWGVAPEGGDLWR